MGRVFFAVLACALLSGCGAIQRQQMQAENEAQRQRSAAGAQECRTRFPVTPTSKNHADLAHCLVDMENRDPPLGAYPDLVFLKQSHYIRIMSKIDNGTLSVEDAGVQIAQILTQIASEGQRRQVAARMVGAQEQAAEAQRQAAFAQTLSAVAASMPKPQPSASVSCTTTGTYEIRTTNCY